MSGRNSINRTYTKLNTFSDLWTEIFPFCFCHWCYRSKLENQLSRQCWLVLVPVVRNHTRGDSIQCIWAVIAGSLLTWVLLPWLSEEIIFMWACSVSLHLCNFWTWKKLWITSNAWVGGSGKEKKKKAVKSGLNVKQKAHVRENWCLSSPFTRNGIILVG